MPRAILLFCAQSASIDVSTGRLSAFNLVDRLNVVSLPVVLPELVVGFFLRKDKDEPNTFDLSIIFKSNGNVFNEMPFVVDFAGDSSCKTLVGIQNAILPAPGEWEVILKHKEASLGSYVFDVSKVNVPPTVANTPSTGAKPDAPAKQPQPKDTALHSKPAGGPHATRSRGNKQ